MLEWRELRAGESINFVAEAAANPSRYRRLASETITVSVAADGIRVYDQPAEQADLDDKYQLVTILKTDICLAELQPLFRDTQAAQEVLDEFNRIKLNDRMEGVDKTWRLIVM